MVAALVPIPLVFYAFTKCSNEYFDLHFPSMTYHNSIFGTIINPNYSKQQGPEKVDDSLISSQLFICDATNGVYVQERPVLIDDNNEIPDGTTSNNSTTSSNDDTIDFGIKIPATGATSSPIEYQTLLWGSKDVYNEHEALLPVVVLESKKTVDTLQKALTSASTAATIEAPNIDEQHVSSGLTFSTWLTIEGAPPTQSPTPDTILSFPSSSSTYNDYNDMENIPRPIVTIGDRIVPPKSTQSDDDYDTIDTFDQDGYDTVQNPRQQQQQVLQHGCNGYDFQLSIYKHQFLLSYTDNDEPTYTCRYLVVHDYAIVYGSLTHVAIGFDTVHYTTNIHINGMPIVIGAPNFIGMPATAVNNTNPLSLLSHWNNTRTLQFFGRSSMLSKAAGLGQSQTSTGKYGKEHQDVDNVYYFRGSIQQFEIYDEYLETDQIQLVLQDGIISTHQNDDDIDDIVIDDENSNGKNPILACIDHQSSTYNHTIMIRQDSIEPMEFELTSCNTTTLLLQLAIEIIKVPKHGTLTTLAKLVPMSIDSSSYGTEDISSSSDIKNMTTTDISNTTLLTTNVIGDRIILLIPLGQRGVAFNFTLSRQDYFNVPSKNAIGLNLLSILNYTDNDNTIQYRVLHLDIKNHSNILAVSSNIVHRKVNIVHVNHPINIFLNNETSNSTVILDTNDPRYAVVNNEAIIIQDVYDYNINRVRVDIKTSTNFGFLTLNPTYRNLADFDCASSSSWSCSGTGVHERSMTFVALPDDILYIIRSLQYKSVIPNTSTRKDNDTIIVKIYDGALMNKADNNSNQCLSRAQHMEYYMKQNHISDHTNQEQQEGMMYTIFDECYIREIQIPVPGCDLHLGRSKSKDVGLFASIQSVVAEYIIFCSLILFILTWIYCCCIRSCYRCLARGGRVFPENFDDIENQKDFLN